MDIEKYIKKTDNYYKGGVIMKISNQNLKVNSYTSNLNKTGKKQEKNNERLSSGLAIAKKMEALIAGIGKGVNNTYDMQNALNTADGALGSIGDSLQRVRELSLQASNGLLTDSDKQLIQEEINQTLAGINDMANGAQFNGQNLLDGSFTDKNVAMNPDGSGTTISIGSATTDALGLTNFNVTGGQIDLDAIDNAISAVSSARVQIGAQINRFDYAISSNINTGLNMMYSKSKIEDADMAKESMHRKTNQALIQYGIFAQKNREQNQYNMLNAFILTIKYKKV